jgi:hypothetical protein
MQLDIDGRASIFMSNDTHLSVVGAIVYFFFTLEETMLWYLMSYFPFFNVGGDFSDPVLGAKELSTVDSRVLVTV